MGYDSNGAHALDPIYVAVDGETIQPAQHNTPLADISNSLSMVLVKDGRAPMSGALAMGGNKVTGLGDATNPQDAVTLSQMEAAIPDGVAGAVRFDQAQTLEDSEKSQAQSNIGVSTFVKTILNDADAAAVRTTIGAQQALTYVPLRSATGTTERILRGSASVTTTSLGAATISFPATFTNTPTVDCANGSSAAGIVVSRNSVSTTQFTILARWIADGALVNAGTFTVDWKAVGGVS